MTNFCAECNTEFTSTEQEFCGNCGTPRQLDTNSESREQVPMEVSAAPALQRPPTILLRSHPRPALPKTQKLTEQLESSVEAVSTQPASETMVSVASDDKPSELADEPPTFWQCSQCKHLNPPDAEYCDECGAMYVSPTEQAAKAAAQAKQGDGTSGSLPPEVLAMLTQDIEAGARPGWQIHSGSITNEGVLRQGHADEDSIFVVELRRFYQAKPEVLGLYVVADGMGGQAAGEVASRNAIEGISQIALTELAIPWMSGQNFETAQLEQILHKATLEAHLRIRDWNLKNVKDSGSTLTMACVLDGQAAFANVGDSRTYLFRRGGDITPVIEDEKTDKIELTDTAPTPNLENGRRHTDKLKFKGEVRNTELTRYQEEVEEEMLKGSTHAVEPFRAIRVTRDQSLVQELVESGQLDPDDVYEDPRRNVVLNGLGTSDATVPVDTYSRKLETGDRILLCSDGLWEMVRDPAMAQQITNIADPQTCADELLKLACKNGGADNVSVIVVAVSKQ